MAKKTSKLKKWMSNPHDMIFKEQLGIKEHAECFMNTTLSREVLDQINLETLKLQSGSYVDNNLKEYLSDLLYEVKFKDGEKGFVYFLIEHKSSKDRFSSFQLLKYMVRIWDRYLKDTKKVKKFPIIVPCLFYQGQHEWTYGNNFGQLFDDVLMQYVPDFNFSMFNIRKYEGEFEASSLELHTTVYIMKHIFDEDFQLKYMIALRCVKKIQPDKRKLFLSMLLSYILNSQDRVTAEELAEITEKSLSREEGEDTMSIGKQLYNQGIEEGIEKEKKNSVLLALELKFGKESLFLREKILKISDIQKLDQIINKIIESSDLADIKAVLK